MRRFKNLLLLTLALLLFASPTLSQAATIKLNKTKSTVYTGATTQLKITGTKAKVKWKTSNKNIATVTQKGKVSAKKAGKATITATVGKKNYKCVVTVKDYKLNNTKMELNKGDVYQLKTTTGNPKVKWKTSNTNIATVDSNGNIQAVNEGKATITATINGKDYKSNVEVIKVDYTENIKELRDYINKNGFTFKENKVIRWEDQYGDGRGESLRFLTNGDLRLGSSNTGDGADWDKGFSGNVELIVNYDDMTNADITFEILAKTLEGAIRTNSKIDITKLTRKNNIDFGLDSEKNNRTNEVLDIALSRLNEFMLEEVGMGLNDIGFESYK